MLASLFRRLTAQPKTGAALFDALTKKAREPHWYIEGTVPDTVDGRFALLATLTAMAMIRLEKDEEHGVAASVALTERFVQVMESEHREMGLGDPGLGRQVRKLVGALARRIDLWREAIGKERSWEEAAIASVFREHVSADALAHSTRSLKEFWLKLAEKSTSDLAEGKLG